MTDSAALIMVLALGAAVITGAVILGRWKNPAPRAWFLEHRRPVALAVSGALIAMTGLGMIVHSKLVTTVVVDLPAAEAGESIEAEVVVVTGFARPEASFRRGRNSYTPITSTADGTTVATLLGGSAPAGPGRWTGFTTRSNERDFRERVESVGLHPAAELTRILPESRDDRSRTGSWVALAGIGVFIAGVVWLRR